LLHSAAALNYAVRWAT